MKSVSETRRLLHARKAVAPPPPAAAQSKKRKHLYFLFFFLIFPSLELLLFLSFTDGKYRRSQSLPRSQEMNLYRKGV